MATASVTRNLQNLGQYKLKELKGFNGVAASFAAEHKASGTPALIVAIHALNIADESVWEIASAELKTLAGQRFKTLADSLDAGEEAGHYYAAYEWLQGDHIGARVRDNGLPTMMESLDWIAEACDALATIHRRNIIHRAISPASLFIADSGQASLLHAGWGRMIHATKDGLTSNPWVCVLPFLSPEWAQGLEVEESTDVYSLGAVLLFMLTGQPPIWDDKPEKLKELIATKPVEISLHQDTHPEVIEILTEMLAFDPEDRPVNLPALGDRLRAIAQELNQRLAPVSPDFATPSPDSIIPPPLGKNGQRSISDAINDAKRLTPLPVPEAPVVPELTPEELAAKAEKEERRSRETMMLVIGLASLVLFVGIIFLGFAAYRFLAGGVAVDPEPTPAPVAERTPAAPRGPDPVLIAKHQETLGNLRASAQWLQGYRRINGRWTAAPADLKELGATDAELTDAWGKAFDLRDGFVISAGPDGKWDTDDDFWWDADKDIAGGYSPDATPARN